MKQKEQRLKATHEKLVEYLNNDFTAKEQAFEAEKDTIEKNLAELTNANKILERELVAKEQNMTRLTNSYQKPWQAAQKIKELEEQITALKQKYESKLAKYKQENQSLKDQIALNETKQANGAALKYDMCELAQGLVGTQQAMEKLTQQQVNPKPIGGVVADIKGYPSLDDLKKSPDLLDQKLATTNLLVEQQRNKTPVVIQEHSPAKVDSTVKIVGTGVRDVSKEQNSPPSKRQVIVKQDTAVTPAVKNTNPKSNTQRELNTVPRWK